MGNEGGGIGATDGKESKDNEKRGRAVSLQTRKRGRGKRASEMTNRNARVHYRWKNEQRVGGRKGDVRVQTQR